MKRIIFTLLCVAALAACTKENGETTPETLPDSVPGRQISKIEGYSLSSEGQAELYCTSSFTYDENGRLVTIENVSVYSEGEKWVCPVEITYADKAITYTYLDRIYGEGEVTADLDEQGRTHKFITRTAGPQPLALNIAQDTDNVKEYSMTYDENGYMTKFNNLTFNEVSSLEWKDGNLVKCTYVEELDTDASNFTSIYTEYVPSDIVSDTSIDMFMLEEIFDDTSCAGEQSVLGLIKACGKTSKNFPAIINEYNNYGMIQLDRHTYEYEMTDGAITRINVKVEYIRGADMERLKTESVDNSYFLITYNK